LSYVKIRKENYDKALEELERAVELARKTRADIDLTLRGSRERREKIEARLRRAGLLPD
jgi:hypothetical protein